MTTRLSAMLVLFATAAAAFAQDSVSKTICLPGDAVSPWADADGPNGSEQVNAYVVDLQAFTTSKGVQFGIAPLIKSGKIATDFFNSFLGSQAVSAVQLLDAPFASSSYDLWTGRGFGVNNDADLNDPGEPIDATDLMGNQFGVMFAEAGPTDGGSNYRGLVGALVNFLPSDPGRLYVTRVQAANNSCDITSNYAAFGVGVVDANGNIILRCDDFGADGGVCEDAEGNPLVITDNNNYYRINAGLRDPDILNVISDDFNSDTGGLFDKGATDWVIRRSPTTHNVGNLVPASLTGGGPLILGTNFAGQYVRGYDNDDMTSDTSHRDETVTGQRGTLAYSSGLKCDLLKSQLGVAGILGQRDGLTNILNIWGLADPTPGTPEAGDGEVTASMGLLLPETVIDNATGFENLKEEGEVNEFDNYHSQTAFQGGTSQIAFALDQAGRLLVAAQADHPFDGGASHSFNYIAVARLDCGSGEVAWTMAGYNDDTIGKEGTGKPILDSDDTVIARMVSMERVPGQPGRGPSSSPPMIDSVGNVWFLAAVEVFTDKESIFTKALLRAVYDPDNFAFHLEMVLKEGDVFTGQNSLVPYEIDFLFLIDNNSIASDSAWSHNISQKAHLGDDPDANMSTADPRSLGGMIIAADIVYDVNGDGTFDDCGFAECDSGCQDQSYNVVLYIGALESGVACDPCDANCDGSVDLTDVEPFIKVLLGEDGCDSCTGDTNEDGSVDLTDVEGFIECLLG